MFFYIFSPIFKLSLILHHPITQETISIPITFTPTAPMPYFAQWDIIIEDHAPLSLELFGNGADATVAIGGPLQPDAIAAYRKRAKAGLAFHGPAALKALVAAGKATLSNVSNLVFAACFHLFFFLFDFSETLFSLHLPHISSFFFSFSHQDGSWENLNPEPETPHENPAIGLLKAEASPKLARAQSE